MLVLFGLVARYAVRHQQVAAPAMRSHAHARPVQPAERGVLIINPKSGDGKAERFQLPDEARKRSVEPILLAPGDDLCDLAEAGDHEWRTRDRDGGR